MRETSLTDLICAHHPRFVGARRAYESHTAPVEGGDVRLLSSDVVAVGVGESTTAAGAEALARSLFDDDLAHTVLAVPSAQQRAAMHLEATTPWPWRRVWWWPTNATPKPMPDSSTPASRCCRSPRPNWAPAAAARGGYRGRLRGIHCPAGQLLPPRTLLLPPPLGRCVNNGSPAGWVEAN